MGVRRWLAALVILLLLAPFLPGQDDVQFFPLSQIQPGLKGVGRTVFEGDKIEEFQVEILGVLKNATAPKRDIILARLSGGPLERTGVIAGMSGSPVYIDGKLVGAVALSFPYAKEPLTGITPIEEMLQVVPEPAGAPGRSAAAAGFKMVPIPGLPGEARLIPSEGDVPTDWSKLLPAAGHAGGFVGLPLPIRFGGFPNEVVQAQAPLLRQLGFEPMQGGALSGGPTPATAMKELLPGSMISLMLVRGDLNVNVDCTVTYRQGDNIYACGHRFMLTGPAKIPFAPARVLVTVPNLASSFKLDAPGPTVGSITQDRFGAIYGVVGDEAPQITVRLRVESTLNKVTDYTFQLIQEPFLTPLLLSATVAAALSSTERTIGPATLELKGKVRLANGETVELDDVVAGDANTPNAAGVSVSTPLTYLLSSAFSDMRVEGIELSVASRNEKRVATLEQVWSSESEVSAGDRIELTAVLRTPTGEAIVEKIPVQIPAAVTDKTLSLVVGGGSAINLLQTRLSLLTMAPRDLGQLVRALNRTRRNNRLYALLMSPQRSFVIQGEEYPSPPPSLVQTFLSDPAVAGSMALSATSVVGDFETQSIPYTIRGQKTLFLRVTETTR